MRALTAYTGPLVTSPDPDYPEGSISKHHHVGTRALVYEFWGHRPSVPKENEEKDSRQEVALAESRAKREQVLCG